MESCGLLEPEADELPRLLQEAASWLPSSVLELEAEAFRRYLVPLARSGYPAVHHSAIYRTSYAPAYRVLLASALG